MSGKIFVTGAGGFIGSHLCEELVRQGHKVRAFVHYNSQGYKGWLERSRYAQEIEFIAGDIRDFDMVKRSMTGCSEVMHLAALIGIPYSYETPLAYIRTNIEGTYNILESARQLDLSRVMVTSTSEVYGSALFTPITEKHPLQPQSPYSASKISADQLALSYFLSFKTPVVIARPFNTFGPRQSTRAVVPTIITQMLKNDGRIKIGSTNTIRDLTYVEDTVRGMITILKTDQFIGDSVNIGTGTAQSIAKIIESLETLTSRKLIVETDPNRIRPETSEVMTLISDNSKLRAGSTWVQKESLESGLLKTVQWIKENLDTYTMSQYHV